MNVHFLGSCQTNELLFLANNAIVERNKNSWSSAVEGYSVYNPVETEKALSSADIVVALAINNKNSPFYSGRLRDALGDRLILLPRIYLDGFASLEKSTSNRVPSVRGAEYLIQHSDWPDATKIKHAVMAGEIDMKQKERFDRSISNMKKREHDCCDITISDFIVDNYKEIPMTYAIIHPTQHVMFEVFRRVAKRLNFTINESIMSDQLTWHKRAMPHGMRTVTMHDVAALHLRYGPDTNWVRTIAQM